MTVHVRTASDSAAVGTGAAINRQPARVVYRVAGREYPMVSEPRCYTCQHHRRAEIEGMVITGLSYATVIRRMGITDLTVENLSEHIHRGHMPIDATVSRIVMEDRAKELNINHEDAEGPIVDYIGFARMGVAKVMVDVQEGRQRLTPRHAIQLANLLARVDLAQREEGADMEAVFQGFVIYAQAIAKYAAPDVVEKIAREITTNPTMKALLGRMAAIDASAETA